MASLTQKQVNEFIQNGVLVVPNVLNQHEIDHSLLSLQQTLLKYNVQWKPDDSQQLKESAVHLSSLSTTGGAGGIIDLFYEPWRLDLATNPKIFNAVRQLWSETYGRYNPDNVRPRIVCVIDSLIQLIDNDDDEDSACIENTVIQKLYRHPFGSFDCSTGYVYMNRVCFRVSDDLANSHAKGTKKRRKLQRSLAPHLDCCPHDLFGRTRTELNIEAMHRWRPIQMFVALTHNHQANTGGFECVKGFHHTFDDYFSRKTKETQLQEQNNLKDTVCVGDFCRLLPNEDKEILSQYQHIEYNAGDLVLFDWRIPHANARRNESPNPRVVVYTGFLPGVPLNQKYCRQQLQNYYNKSAPPDFWGRENYAKNDQPRNPDIGDILAKQVDENYVFSELGQKLMGIKLWKSAKGVPSMGSKPSCKQRTSERCVRYFKF